MSELEQTVKMRKKVIGYTREDKSVLETSEAKEAISLINSITFPEKEFITTKAINPKRIVKIARQDLTTLFPNLNRNVLYIPKKDIETIAINSEKKKLSELETIRTINNKASTIDLFNLPLNYTMQEYRDGSALLCSPVPNDPLLIPQVKNVVSQIDLAGPADYLTAIIYAHESIHLLPRRFKGIIEDYYHEELLPIFLEKVLALEADPTEELIQKLETFRVRAHQKDISVITKRQEHPEELGHQHLISGLLANCMFDRYYHETPAGRRYILNEIHNILNGNKTVSSFLEEQEITLSTSEVVTATEHSVQKCLIKK